jgi:hypothetical protein
MRQHDGGAELAGQLRLGGKQPSLRVGQGCVDRIQLRLGLVHLHLGRGDLGVEVGDDRLELELLVLRCGNLSAQRRELLLFLGFLLLIGGDLIRVLIASVVVVRESWMTTFWPSFERYTSTSTASAFCCQPRLTDAMVFSGAS